MAGMCFDVVYAGVGNNNLVNAWYVSKYGDMAVDMNKYNIPSP
jgi:hypothetical protein